MVTTTLTTPRVRPGTNWIDVVREVGPAFAARAAEHDEDDTFVAENYAELKKHKIFSAGVPSELGGGGATYEETAAMLRELAHHCASTALALSMHQHLVAAAIWRYRRGQPGEQVLRKVAESEAVLVSTGANDWLASNGEMTRVEGGYRVSARKIFCSGSPAGAVLVTSAAYDDPEAGKQVLHFPVPFSAEGVTIEETWRAHGMRGTGSNDVTLDNVFVPDEAIQVRRPAGEYHPLFNVIATVALPLIMSVYLGIAESAAATARERAAKKQDDPSVPYILGEMENLLAVTQLAVESMVGQVRNYAVEPTIETGNAALIRKTLAANSARATVEKAIEAVGGAAYFRKYGLERALRDVRAAVFHPLPEKKQVLFTGRLALGLDPVIG